MTPCGYVPVAAKRPLIKSHKRARRATANGLPDPTKGLPFINCLSRLRDRICSIDRIGTCCAIFVAV